jgi:hypothetical protein
MWEPPGFGEGAHREGHAPAMVVGAPPPIGGFRENGGAGKLALR